AVLHAPQHPVHRLLRLLGRLPPTTPLFPYPTLFRSGSDVVVLGAGPGPGGEVLVPLAAVTSLRAGPGDGPVVGDRPTGDGPTLVDLLADLAAERAAVRVVTVGGDAVAGELRAVGRDVLVVAPSGGGAAYVALGAVAEVAVGSPGPA